MDQDPRPEPGASSNPIPATQPASKPTLHPSTAIMVLDLSTPAPQPSTTDSHDEWDPNSVEGKPLLPGPINLSSAPVPQPFPRPTTRPAAKPEPELSSDSSMPPAELSSGSDYLREPRSLVRRRCGKKGRGKPRCCSFCDSFQHSMRGIEGLVAQLQDQVEDLQRRREEEIGELAL